MYTNPISKESDESKDFEKGKFKTTNVNILLNRVKLDKKRTLKKKIIFSIII